MHACELERERERNLGEIGAGKMLEQDACSSWVPAGEAPGHSALANWRRRRRRRNGTDGELSSSQTLGGRFQLRE